MHKRFDTGKQPYDATKDTQATAPSQKPRDFVRLSSESTRENPRLLTVTKEVAQAKDRYSKGSLYELQREKQQRELHQKATGEWHPQDLSHPRPPQRLLGGVLTGSEKTTTDFLTPEERTAKNQYYLGVRNEKTRIGNNIYKKLHSRMQSDKKSYTEEDIIENLNKTRQGTEYKNAFGYNTSYNPNDSGSTEHHEEVGESSQPESEDDRFRQSLLQSLAQHYRNERLHVSHLEAYVGHFNKVRKTNYTSSEMLQLLHDEGYLTS